MTMKVGCAASKMAFDYRLLLNGIEVFRHRSTAVKRKSQPCRIGVFGDLANGKQESFQMTNLMYEQNPDLVVVPGDIS